MRGESVLVVHLTGGFGRRAILTLPCRLLHWIVRHQKAGVILAEIKGQPVSVGKIAIELRVEATGAGLIGEVLQRWGIQVSIRVAGLRSEGHRRAICSVLMIQRADISAEAACLKVNFQSLPRPIDAPCVQRNNSTQASPVLWRDASRHDADCFKLAVFERWR